MFKATKVSNFSYTARAGCIVCAAPRNNNSAFCLIHGVILFDLCIPPVCFILLIIITQPCTRPTWLGPKDCSCFVMLRFLFSVENNTLFPVYYFGFCYVASFALSYSQRANAFSN